MSVKNAVSKAWHNSGGGTPTPSFDGKIYSIYLDGNKPTGFQTSPKIVGTDIKGITLVNNYNGLGSWFKVFGYGLGTNAAMGTSAGARVYVRDPAGDNVWHEVASYLKLDGSRTYARNQLMRLTVQVGSLGGSQVNGRALDVKVTVNGVDSNVLTAKLINQGPRNFYFASPAGNDSTGVVNDINHPYRYVQNASGGTYLGIWAVWKPGDTIVIRGNGGTWTDQLAACNTRWVQFPFGPAFAVTTGTAPTGNTTGTLTGYYTFYGYPGEDVHATFSTGGGIQGCDSARAQAGSGQYVQITGLRMDTLGGAARDAGPINFQSGADNWIATDCECGPWIAGSSSVLNSSAIGGQCSNTYVAFNYCHDVQGLSDLQNHGMYYGGVSGGTGYDNCTFNTEVCYNWIENSTGGSGIQFYWQGGNSKYFTGIKCHHNFVDTTAKYAINIGDSSVSGDHYNNICINAGWSALRLCPPSGQTPAINVEHNTFYAWNGVHGSATTMSAVINEGYITTGSAKVNHNIICAPAGRGGAYGISWYGNNGAGDTTLSASQNLYFDPDGATTGGWSIDTSSITTDPKFTSISNKDFTLATGSPALDATTTTEAVTVSDDFYGMARPSGAHNDVGACEGVGV